MYFQKLTDYFTFVLDFSLKNRPNTQFYFIGSERRNRGPPQPVTHSKRLNWSIHNSGFE